MAGPADEAPGLTPAFITFFGGAVVEGGGSAAGGGASFFGAGFFALGAEILTFSSALSAASLICYTKKFWN